jgi:NADPH-dependent 7-cyano-7-deazaguanine reductase QueF-like protein
MMNVVLDSPWRLSHKSSEFKLILSLYLDGGWTHTFIQWISHSGQPYEAAICMMNVVLDSPERLSHKSSEFKLILSLHLEVGWTHTFIQWISHSGQPYEAAIFMMIVVLDGPWRLPHESSEFKLILSLHLDVGWTHTLIQWISHSGQPYEVAIFMMNVVWDSPWRLSYESSTDFVTACGCWLNIGLQCVS